MKVLIVDDEIEILESVCELLEENYREGNSFHKSYVARQAAELLQQEKFDILLTDIRMPVYSGLELAKIAKGANPDCHVILLTAYSDFDYAYKAIRQGCDGYILKTDGDGEILLAFQKVLEKAKTEAEERRLISRAEKRRDEFTGQEGGDQMGFVTAYIRQHLTEELSLQRLAGLFFTNPSYLSRQFKEKTGTGINEYITALRLECAKELLSTSKLTIGEVSRRAGFESQNYFGQVFKKAVGIKPSEFRQQFMFLED